MLGGFFRIYLLSKLFGGGGRGGRGRGGCAGFGCIGLIILAVLAYFLFQYLGESGAATDF